MLLRLTDGTTTLTLSGSGTYLGATYFPQTPTGGATEITETATVILEGTEAAIRAAVNDIEQLFEAARTRAGNLSPRVFVEFRPVDSGDIYRAEVLAGTVSWSPAPAKRYLYGTLNTVEVAVIWTRRVMWEAPEEELYLSSSTQTERVGGVTIYNNDNAGTPNWVGIASNRVKGTRPAPLRIRITNQSGATLNWRNIHIGNNVFSSPAAADVWLLGSEATGGASQSWPAGVDHNTLTWVFPLSATLLGQAQGRTFRVLVAFDNVSAAAYVRGAVGSYKDTVFGAQRTGKERYGAGELVDLGAFPIPPGGYNAANAGAALAVTVRSASSGSGQIDFVQLLATDSYRKLEQVGYTVANGESVEDDGIEGATYMLSGSNRYPLVRPGPALTAYPEKTQRLYVLFDENNAFVAGRQMTVQAWYRPNYDSI
jgi:hypothetical protein